MDYLLRWHFITVFLCGCGLALTSGIKFNKNQGNLKPNKKLPSLPLVPGKHAESIGEPIPANTKPSKGNPISRPLKPHVINKGAGVQNQRPKPDRGQTGTHPKLEDSSYQWKTLALKALTEAKDPKSFLEIILPLAMSLINNDIGDNTEVMSYIQKFYESINTGTEDPTAEPPEISDRHLQYYGMLMLRRITAILNENAKSPEKKRYTRLFTRVSTLLLSSAIKPEPDKKLDADTLCVTLKKIMANSSGEKPIHSRTPFRPGITNAKERRVDTDTSGEAWAKEVESPSKDERNLLHEDVTGKSGFLSSLTDRNSIGLNVSSITLVLAMTFLSIFWPFTLKT